MPACRRSLRSNAVIFPWLTLGKMNAVLALQQRKGPPEDPAAQKSAAASSAPRGASIENSSIDSDAAVIAASPQDSSTLSQPSPPLPEKTGIICVGMEIPAAAGAFPKSLFDCASKLIL